MEDWEGEESRVGICKMGMLEMESFSTQRHAKVEYSVFLPVLKLIVSLHCYLLEKFAHKQESRKLGR